MPGRRPRLTGFGLGGGLFARNRQQHFLLRRRGKQRQHICAVARHDRDLGYVRAKTLCFQEALHEKVESRRVAEIVVRKNDPQRVLVRAFAHAPHLVGIVAHLEV